MVQINPIRYKGCSTLMTSTANQEIVPEIPDTDGVRYTFTSFSFFNLEDVQVIINNDETHYFVAKTGFQTNSLNTRINSFVIVTPNVNFTWIAEY